MMIEPCYCACGIPGVDRLPAHYHPASPNDRYEHETPDKRVSEVRRYLVDGVTPDPPIRLRSRPPRLVRDPDQEPHFFVDWKRVARELEVARG